MTDNDGVETQDEGDESPTLPELFAQLHQLLSCVSTEDPGGTRRTCVSIGDAGAGVLLLAALKGRFDVIVDVSYGRPDDSPWLQRDHFQRVAPGVEIHSFDGDVFDDASLTAALECNGGSRFEFCFMEKTLHHLRLNRCKLSGSKDHDCDGDECVGVFAPEAIFPRLFQYAKTVIISEFHYTGEDNDKEGVRGGMLTIDEIESAFTWLSTHSRLRVLRPRLMQVSPVRSRGAFRSRIGEHLERSEYFLISASAALARRDAANPVRRRGARARMRGTRAR